MGGGAIVHREGGSNLHVTPGLGPLPNLAMMPGSDQHYRIIMSELKLKVTFSISKLCRRNNYTNFSK